MKKLVALALVLIMALGLCACGKSNADKYPEGPIEIIVPFAAGGAMDASADGSINVPDVLKKYLGVEVTINNMTGGANWVGYQAIEDANGDGYTLGFANYPGQVGGYLDPSKERKETYKSFTNIANIVHDAGMIVVKEDSPYKTLAEFLEAAKTQKLTVSTGGGKGSDDDVLVRLINAKMGTQLVPGGNENDAKAKAALLGGEADAQACNVSNYCKTYTVTGQTDSVRVLAIFDANKQELMPDIPTIDECGIAELKGLYSSSDRGLIATKNLDKDVLAKIVDALKKTQTDPDFLADAATQGMGINMLFGDDFEKYIQGWEDTLKGMAKDLGWE